MGIPGQGEGRGCPWRELVLAEGYYVTPLLVTAGWRWESGGGVAERVDRPALLHTHAVPLHSALDAG